MKKTFAVVILGIMLMPALNAQPPVNRPLRITVAMRQSNDTEALVNSKLIASLAKSCKQWCAVVDPAMGLDGDEAKADASLLGTWHLEQPCSDCAWYMAGGMRLVGRDGTVLWSDEVREHAYRNVTGKFADETAKRLVKYLAGE